jgi:uncharacterized phosphosugar-binding protein
VNPGEHLDQSRLACAIFAEKGEDFARPHAQRNASYRGDAAEALDDAIESDERRFAAWAGHSSSLSRDAFARSSFFCAGNVVIDNTIWLQEPPQQICSFTDFETIAAFSARVGRRFRWKP